MGPRPLERGAHVCRGQQPRETADRPGTRAAVVAPAVESLVVGTDASCELVSDDPVVSRRHCQVLRDPAGFRVKDLKSKNGCHVAGVRVVDVFLRPGQVLELGTSRLWIEVGPTPTEVALVPASTFGEVVGSGAAALVDQACRVLLLPATATYLDERRRSLVCALLGGAVASDGEALAHTCLDLVEAFAARHAGPPGLDEAVRRGALLAARLAAGPGPGLARALRVRPRLPLDVAGAVPAALARRLRRFTGGA